jgi:bacillolysin
MNLKHRHSSKRLLGSSIVLLLVCALLLGACNVDSSQLAGTTASADQVTAALALLQGESEGGVQVEIYEPTGAARWLSAEQGALTRQFARERMASDVAASAFLANYGTLFGLTDPPSQMRMTTAKRDENGAQHIRFAQQQNGVPVFGADLIVHLERDGSVQVVNGYTLPDAPAVNTTPTVSAEAAAQAAIAHVGLADGTVTERYLEIFNPALITDQPSATYLTYRLLVDSPSQPELAQWVFVDAHTAEIRFSYSAVYEARNRSTYNLRGSTTYGSASLARHETAAPVTTATGCTAADINNAHDYAGHTYDFYFSRFGRDSYDGAGAPMRSYVCYGSGYQNAFWDGSRMTYGEGFAIDDVVGHEFSHGVTQYISGLTYSYQSGALNESFSDIMGEAIDLANGQGNDSTAVRWAIGEELPSIGAIRDMMDPTRFGLPDRTDSPYFYCGTGDSGGVHINSSVQNKAFALMVDGGTFNGFTMDAVGLDKALQIVYRANDRYLTSSAKFIDAYHALNRSCNELYGATSADCSNVKKALDATKMNGPVCGVGSTPQPQPTPAPMPQLVNGGFESGRNVGWTESDSSGYPLVTQGNAATGSWRAWLGGANNNSAQITQNYAVPAGGATLRYAYRVTSADVCGYDYGYVQVNSTVLRSYNLCSSNQTGTYVQGSVSLSAYAGQTVAITFRATTDSLYVSSFYIDDVSVGAGGLAEEADPYASIEPTTPEAKPETPVEEDVESKEGAVEQGEDRIFLPLINN